MKGFSIVLVSFLVYYKKERGEAMPLHIIRQDITMAGAEAVINTTNEKMIGYSGVDFAVHTAAGPELDEYCRKLIPLNRGEVKVTPGFSSGAKYILHTIGPLWRGGNSGEEAELKVCYINALEKAVELDCESVAVPLISSGAHGFPKNKVLNFAVQVISDFLFENEITVYLCVYDRSSYEFSKKLFTEIKDFIGEIQVPSIRNIPSPRMEYYESSVLCAETNYCCCTESALYEKESSHKKKTLEEYMKNMDKPFAFKLFDLIDEKGMTDVECYKKANVDKKTFSKIKCNSQSYKPSKQTAVAFAIALELSLEQTQDLLASAGLTLSESFIFDKIIRYFIEKGIYDIFMINEALFEFDQMLLGC